MVYGLLVLVICRWLLWIKCPHSSFPLGLCGSFSSYKSFVESIGVLNAWFPFLSLAQGIFLVHSF